MVVLTPRPSGILGLASLFAVIVYWYLPGDMLDPPLHAEMPVIVARPKTAMGIQRQFLRLRPIRNAATKP